jgi:hypothetical protein
MTEPKLIAELASLKDQIDTLKAYCPTYDIENDLSNSQLFLKEAIAAIQREINTAEITND